MCSTDLGSDDAGVDKLHSSLIPQHPVLMGEATKKQGRKVQRTGCYTVTDREGPSSTEEGPERTWSCEHAWDPGRPGLMHGLTGSSGHSRDTL